MVLSRPRGGSDGATGRDEGGVLGVFVRAYGHAVQKERLGFNWIMALTAVRVLQWIDTVRREKGDPDWWPTDADVQHSALLQRLFEGKHALPAPPPNGNHALIDRGYEVYPAEFVHAYASGSVFEGPVLRSPDRRTPLQPGWMVLLGSGGTWQIQAQVEPGKYAVKYIPERSAPGTWHLMFLDDEIVSLEMRSDGEAVTSRGSAWALVRTDAEAAFRKRDRSQPAWSQ